MHSTSLSVSVCQIPQLHLSVCPSPSASSATCIPPHPSLYSSSSFPFRNTNDAPLPIPFVPSPLLPLIPITIPLLGSIISFPIYPLLFFPPSSLLFSCPFAMLSSPTLCPCRRDLERDAGAALWGEVCKAHSVLHIQANSQLQEAGQQQNRCKTGIIS
jgi:hypothetical protein